MRKVNLILDRIILLIKFLLKEKQFILRSKCFEITNKNRHFIFKAINKEI